MVLSAVIAATAGRNPDHRVAACVCGPLATRRKRMAFACLCAERSLGLQSDQRVRQLIEAGRRYSEHGVPGGEVEAALRAAEVAAADAERRAGRSVWTIFEGRRTGDARAEAGAARIVTEAVRWALGLPDGRVPPLPRAWAWAAAALAAPVPGFAPGWQTAEVLALARLVRDRGETELLPILADALQDAGCDDEQILAHCRDSGPHTAACWVPDLVLDAE